MTMETKPVPGSGNKLPANTFDGKVVSMQGSQLVMSSADGKEHTHTVGKEAKLTCDGQTCKAEEVKPGSRVRVTTHATDRNVATCVEALKKNTEFAKCV